MDFFAEELRGELGSNRRITEEKSMELNLEKKCIAELDDALQRSILGHIKMVEHYVELQEEHNDLIRRHKKLMKCVEEVKKAVAKASLKKGTTSDKAFAAALAKEMSSSRLERERECMAKPFDGKNILRVDLYVDAKCAKSWYAAK